MDDSKRQIRASSIADFLFMPQLRLSFQHFSFIAPVFMRTLALMFVGAGMLPQDHPATLYGAEGAKKYGLFELMGEVWRQLRASPATTPFQWGLFISVALMFFFTVISAIIFVFYLTKPAVSAAHAQIFDSPITDPGAMAPSTSGLFNNAIGTGVHADYGIMIIDKLFREGIAGSGGMMQNSLGGLMELYNTGVLVIAGIIVFWAILTIVVDTARTGQIGGGRHNMVWAPIRIVFALGLMIPLGSSGFSSGQFMVMKLAEWGSNFGTRGWNKYVEGFSGEKIFAPPTDRNLTSLVANFQKMWICRVAYNGATMAATHEMPPEQEIKRVDMTGVLDYGVKSFEFTNATRAKICGSVQYGKYEPPSAAEYALGVINPLYLVADAGYAYFTDNAKEYATLFGSEEDSPDGLEKTAKKFACGFVSQHIFGPDPGGADDPLRDICAGTGYESGVCGAGAPDGPNRPKEPDMSCINEMVIKAQKQIRAAKEEAFNDYTAAVKPKVIEDIKKSGWPAMGAFYYKLAVINKALLSAERPPLSIQPGKGGPGRGEAIDSEHAKTVKKVMERYSVWWQTIPPAAAKLSETELEGYVAGGGTTSYKADTEAATDDEGDVDNTYADSMGNIVRDGMATDTGPDLFDVKESELYPLTQLVQTGHAIIMGSVIMMSAISAVQAVLGLLDITATFLGFGGNLGNFGASIAGSMLFEALFVLGAAMMGAGIMLSFWVPMIPFVRVAFSVLTWMVSIFEAVMMVPIAALAHLSTEGDGIAGGARQAWILWLNVLLRPILTVVGFVGSLLVFNTFVIYYHAVYGKISVLDSGNTGIFALFALIANAIIYVGVIYTAANSSFKLLDLIPAAMMKWIGGGQADTSFDESHAISGMVSRGGGAVTEAASAARRAGKEAKQEKKKDAGLTGS